MRLRGIRQLLVLLIIVLVAVSAATVAQQSKPNQGRRNPRGEASNRQRPPTERQRRRDPFKNAPQSLGTVPVPVASDISDYIRDEAAAVLLGKSLFWDMQVGSDGRTACASCHFSAGADNRITNTLHPGAPGSAFGPQREGQAELLAIAKERFHSLDRPNTTVTRDDFPFHLVSDPSGGDDNEVVRSSPEIVGSAGVKEQDFVQINEQSPVDTGTDTIDPDFTVGGAPSRQVTIRNAPTVINAAYLDRTFWDGRGNRYFNGVNAFGDRDPDAGVWVESSGGGIERTLNLFFSRYPWARAFEPLLRRYAWLLRIIFGDGDQGEPVLEKTQILIDNAALASQATDQANNGSALSWIGRSFPDLGRKMLSLRPLALQTVRDDDSVLGPFALSPGTGLREQVSYQRLIQLAFAPRWWNSDQLTPDGYTQMEANFSLYWGLAIAKYESTLVSDQTPYDAWIEGDQEALSEDALAGLRIFLNEGRCIECHCGPEFAGATVSRLRPLRGRRGSDSNQTVEFRVNGRQKLFDDGFFNTGVRPTLEDLGVGAAHPQFGELSYSRQRRGNRRSRQARGRRRRNNAAVDGAFKAPTLRNVELTGPYMHNGGMSTLTEVVEFYARGTDFADENADSLGPHLDGIPELQDNPDAIFQVVEFLKSLTDERVRFGRAPFDHPELVVSNGHNVQDGMALDELATVPPLGENGGRRTRPFQEIIGIPDPGDPGPVPPDPNPDPGNNDDGDFLPIQFGYVPFTQDMPVAPVKQPLSVGAPPFEVGNVFHGVAPEFFNRVDAATGEPYFEAFPTAFYEMRMQHAVHEFFPGVQTPVCAYDGIVPGPTFKARVGQPVVVRQRNELNNIETSVHLHGGHNPAHSDGYPNFFVLPGRARDYYYTNTVPNLNGQPDFTEAPSTMWYHDHGMDITAQNVLRGLAGFFITQDELEVGLVQSNVLPQDAHDIPIVVQDKIFNPDGTIFFDPLDHNGYLGDTFVVNGKVLPQFRVQRRKYRFRFLNGANARFFLLRLSTGQPFIGLGKDTWLFPNAISRDTLLLGMANRADVVVDFTNAPDELFLENILEQTDGRGPQGDLEEPDILNPGIPILKFVVEGPPQTDSATVDVGTALRPHIPIEPEEIVATRVFEFERRQGAWQINQRFFDENLANATPTLGTAERWILRNEGGGWWHPIHIHLESHQFQSVDGLPPPPEDAFKSDTAVLGPNTEVEIFMNFRTFLGPFVFHCHNLEHEDMRMMFVFDPRLQPTQAPQPIQQSFP